MTKGKALIKFTQDSAGGAVEAVVRHKLASTATST